MKDNPRGNMATSCGASKPVKGGCAFRGAKMALQPITDALHVIHGPNVCSGHSWTSRPTESAGSKLHRLTVSSAIGELDVIFGGDAKLLKTLLHLVERFDPPAIFVYQTCIPSMTGDDIAATCRSAAEQAGRPIIAVDAPGISGGKLAGAQKAADVLLRHVIGTREPEHTTATDVVLIGDFNVAGESGHISALLGQAGMRVVASIPGGGRFADIAGAHRARLAIGHCSQSIGNLAAALHARHGVPFIEASFYGERQTSRTLRMAAHRLVEVGAPSALIENCDSFIAAAEARLAAHLAPLRPILSGKRALIMTGGVKTWSLAATLQDLGLEVMGVTANKTSAADMHRLSDIVHSPGRIISGSSARDLQHFISQSQIDLVLGGGNARFMVAAAGIPWIEINHERRMSLTGYDGTANLAQALAAALSRPTWRELRAASPW